MMAATNTPVASTTLARWLVPRAIMVWCNDTFWPLCRSCNDWVAIFCLALTSCTICPSTLENEASAG